MDYEVTLTGRLDDGTPCMQVGVVVPVTSLCPCSKTISEYGAHNQRSHVIATVELNDALWIEDLIDGGQLVTWGAAAANDGS